VPNLVLVEPSVEAEVRVLLDYLVNVSRESGYLRLVSVKWPVPFGYPAEQAVSPGTGWVVREGTDAVVFGYGPWLLSNAWHAAAELERSGGPSLRIVNLPWLNRIDRPWLRRVIGASRAVVTLDNHYIHGGQGQMIAAAAAELGLNPSVPVTAVGVSELPECGTNDEVLEYHRLDIASLAAAFRAAVEKHGRPAVSQLA
jgi:transketolase